VHRLRVEEALAGPSEVERSIMAMARTTHLVSRFFSSLVPFPVRQADQEWVASVLAPEELALWTRLSRADRRESIAVARRTAVALADTDYDADPRWLAAALLHDVGKLDARFGPIRRSLATLITAVVGRRTVEGWVDKSGFIRRCALYTFHDQLGGDRLRMAGGRSEAVLWAEAHHRPAIWDTTGLPTTVVVALATADGEPTEGFALSDR
jgi:hypothetical protein